MIFSHPINKHEQVLFKNKSAGNLWEKRGKIFPVFLFIVGWRMGKVLTNSFFLGGRNS